ncbi:hypothetical protein D3C81_1349050 [compost metagenome]
MQFTRLSVGGVPTGEIGQAQGDVRLAVRVGGQAVLDAQGKGRAVRTKSGPVAFLRRQRAAGRVGPRDRDDVEARRQLGERSSQGGFFRQVEQGGGGAVEMAHLADAVQGHHRHRGQGGVEHGVLGHELSRQLPGPALQRPADFSENPGHDGEQRGVGGGVAQAFARHQAQIDGDGQDNGQCGGGAPCQQGSNQDRRKHGQIVELAQPFEQASEAERSRDRDNRQRETAPAAPGNGACETQDTFHHWLNGLSLTLLDRQR